MNPIVVVEDTSSLREALLAVLSGQNLSAVGFPNAEEALTFLRTHESSCVLTVLISLGGNSVKEKHDDHGY